MLDHLWNIVFKKYLTLNTRRRQDRKKAMYDPGYSKYITKHLIEHYQFFAIAIDFSSPIISSSFGWCLHFIGSKSKHLTKHKFLRDRQKLNAISRPVRTGRISYQANVYVQARWWPPLKSVLFKITCAQVRGGLSHARITVRLRRSFRLPNRRNRNKIEPRRVPKISKAPSGKHWPFPWKNSVY